MGQFLRLTEAMPAQQLHLFDPARPLLDRLGAAFFKAVPPRPGVYIMSGAADQVLYIGQSGNLRRRLGSYRNARPDRAPRKVIRLVHSVRSLVWEECASPEGARLKEAQLLRIHRPKFNKQNTYPRAYLFISLRQTAGRLALSVDRDPRAGWRSHGAFKPGTTHAFGALLRLLWAARGQAVSPHDFPGPLLRARPPREFQLAATADGHKSAADELSKHLDRFLSGESDGLIGSLTAALPASPEVSAFQRGLFAADLETLAAFYLHGPRRNRELRLEHGLGDGIIPHEALDELLAVRPREKRVEPAPDDN
jgi:excinuclease UvrABC nuclease subunit